MNYRLRFSFVVFCIFFLMVFLWSAYSWFTETILKNAYLLNFDLQIMQYINDFRNPYLTDFFLGYTLLGKTRFVVLVMTFAIIYFLYKKHYLAVVRLMASVWFTSAVVVITKMIVWRARPELSVYQETGLSFPSFHAAIAVALYWYLTLYFSSYIAKKYTVWYVVSCMLAIIQLAFSLVYLNVHFMSDVVLWMIVGWTILYLSYFLQNSYRK